MLQSFRNERFAGTFHPSDSDSLVLLFLGSDGPGPLYFHIRTFEEIPYANR